MFICAFSCQEASSFGSMKGFFVRERMRREKKGGGGQKADRRGLGRSAIFQQAGHTT